MIKVVYTFRRRPDRSPEEFATYWNDVHGPLGARLPGLRRLVQSHAVAVAGDVRPADHDGVAELWFDDAASLLAARESPEWQAATRDESHFIAPGSETYAVTTEHEVMIPTTTAGWPRLVVLGLFENEAGDVLLCRMPPQRPFAGKWALPGGGVEPGEGVEEALRREAREELGLEVTSSMPLFFLEGRHEKVLPDGNRIQRHMIFLLFRARARAGDVHLNPEFDAHAWVPREELGDYELNPATRATLVRLELIRG